MKLEKQKKLCEKIYKFAVENGACDTVEVFKRYFDDGDFDKAINLANSERAWLARRGFKQKHFNEISRHCGGYDVYKTWHKNGRIREDRKSKFEYKVWHDNGQIRVDRKSEYISKAWSSGGAVRHEAHGYKDYADSQKEAARGWIDAIEFTNKENRVGPGGSTDGQSGSDALVARAMDDGWAHKRCLFVCHGESGIDHIISTVKKTGRTYDPWIPYGIKRALWRSSGVAGLVSAVSYDCLSFCIAPRQCHVDLSGSQNFDFIYFDHFEDYYRILDLTKLEEFLASTGNPKVYAASSRPEEIRAGMLKKFEYQKSVDFDAR